MKERAPFVLPIIVGLVLLAVIILALPENLFSGWGKSRRGNGLTGDESRIEGDGRGKTGDAGLPYDPSSDLLAALLRGLSSKNTKPNEAILTFDDADAMKAFLERADKAGLKVLGTLDKLNAVRVGFDDIRALRDDMLAHAGDYAGWGGNVYAYIPDVPAAENRPQQQEQGFGEGMLAFMGVKGDISNWGKGVTIAILDTGISEHAAFGPGRVKSIDIGMGLTGTSDSDGHATAVASLAAGLTPGATGVAPAADLLSIRVTNSEGVSDMFTLAQGIQTAVDAGAKVINISLGSYSDSSIMSRMIQYAEDHGAIVVASAGNDTATQLTWPAADSRVISVGAVDALGQQLSFSNSGEGLSATAPGLGLSAAWPGNQIISFDGTSGSAPLMSGAIASVLSIYPQLTARQAASLLLTYSGDAGAAGQDPDYGYGTTDIGYALNHANTSYIDTSVSSQYYHPDQNSVEFVVQNRSGIGVTDLTLTVNAGGNRETIQVPYLEAGARWSYFVPVDQAKLVTDGEITFTSQLRNPNGIVDQNPGNNRKASVISDRSLRNR